MYTHQLNSEDRNRAKEDNNKNSKSKSDWGKYFAISFITSWGLIRSLIGQFSSWNSIVTSKNWLSRNYSSIHQGILTLKKFGKKFSFNSEFQAFWSRLGMSMIWVYLPNEWMNDFHFTSSSLLIEYTWGDLTNIRDMKNFIIIIITVIVFGFV